MHKRVVFMATDPSAVLLLQALQEQGFEVLLIYTKAPKLRGRGLKPVASPILTWAEIANVPVNFITSFKQQKLEIETEIARLNPDWIVVFAFGFIIPKSILDLPHLGCINVHASLLPRWRGASPIEHALHFGDEVTGISIMQMEEGLDTGPVYASQAIAIHPEDDINSLRHKLFTLAAELLPQTLRSISKFQLIPMPQSLTAITSAPKITEDLLSLSVQQDAFMMHNKIRALKMYNLKMEVAGISCVLTSARPIRQLPGETVVSVGNLSDGHQHHYLNVVFTKQRLYLCCAQNTHLEILELTPINKKRLSAAEFINQIRSTMMKQKN